MDHENPLQTPSGELMGQLIRLDSNLSIDQEIDTYLRLSDPSIGFSTLLNYWKEMSRISPRLAKAAEINLGMPGSAGAIERDFSLVTLWRGNCPSLTGSSSWLRTLKIC